jgi:uncharacterized membrane protein YecN with MAPEG domain
MPPLITALYGALNAILNVLLAERVTRMRKVHKTSIGQGDAEPLLVAIRAHANNAEFVPLAIVMMLLVELCGGSHMYLHITGGLLFVARIAHAVGLPRPAPNPFRFSGVAITLTAIVANAGYVLYLRTTF